MRSHKYIVVILLYSIAQIVVLFTQHKCVTGFCIDTKGQVQATSKVKCQSMTFMATICIFQDVISKPNVTYGIPVCALQLQYMYS